MSDPGEALTAAIVAEFGVDDDLYVGFANALSIIAETVKSGVFSMRRSELRMAVNGQDEQFRDLAPLIDRYTLPCRKGWAATPVGASARDYDLDRKSTRLNYSP